MLGNKRAAWILFIMVAAFLGGLAGAFVLDYLKEYFS